MAFLECQTLRQFFQATSIFEIENRAIIQKVFNSIDYLLKILFEERVFHGDLHELNVMLCSPRELNVNEIAKFIDIDTMQYFSDDDEYNINIVNKMTSDSDLTMFPSLSDTKSDALEIGMGIIDSILSSNTSLSKKEISSELRKHYNLGMIIIPRVT